MFNRIKNALRYITEGDSVIRQLHYELRVAQNTLEERNRENAGLKSIITAQAVNPVREELEEKHDGELPPLPLEALSMAETLFRLSCEADEAEAKKKTANAKFDIVNEALTKQMVANRLPQFIYRGFNFELDTEFHVNVLKANKPHVQDWLRNNGHTDLLTEDYNASSFKSLVKEIREQNNDELPEDLARLVTIYEPVIVSMTKAKKNSAKARRVDKVISKQQPSGKEE
jgi:predicted house-cleaning noncanonical NTP pyrophosphatase (MazG superfamily)